MKKILFACCLLGAVVSGHKDERGAAAGGKPKRVKQELSWPFVMWSKTNIAQYEEISGV